MDAPNRVTEPPVGSSAACSMRTTVVLPDPEGPSRHVCLPSATFIVRSARPRVPSGKYLETDWNSMTVAMASEEYATILSQSPPAEKGRTRRPPRTRGRWEVIFRRGEAHGV